MAETTAISWATSTFNPVIGCTKVGPGCDHCYAEALDRRHRWDGATHWGAGVERKVTSDDYWRQPFRWNDKAARSGKPWRVFCASLSDVFDNEWPEGVRERLWYVIQETPCLTWMLLTKRIGNVRAMLPPGWRDRLPDNLWLGATVVNQEEANRDIVKLLEVPARVRWLSCEPLLGPLDLTQFMDRGTEHMGHHEFPGIDWVIVGGESGPGARYFELQWARDLRDQCEAAGVQFFMKQVGAFPIDDPDGDHGPPIHITKHRAGADPTEWPQDLRIQQFPT